MEPLSFHPLLQVTPEEIKLVRKSLNLDENKIQESIDSLLEWWKKQDHLVEALSTTPRGVIERYFIAMKGSLEFTKIKIDKLLTMRGVVSEMVLNKCNEEFDILLDNMCVLTLPKLNPADHTRISMMCYVNKNFEDFNVLTFMRYSFLLTELRTFYNYRFEDRYILDLKHFKAYMLKRINPVLLKKAEILVLESYGLRVKGIHMINAPPYVDKLVNLFKLVLKEKIARRIHVHPSYEDLHNEISKEILPEDYGGDAPSCRNLNEQWRAYFKSQEGRKIIEASNKFYSNESRRSCFEFNQEYLGIPGSFKRLNID